MRFHSLLPVLVSLCAAPLVAQTVWHVGPGQPLPTIGAAIAIASPGDVLAVRAGTYPPFTLDKGLTIRAEPVGAAVNVAYSASATTTMLMPGNAHARICGVDFPNLLHSGGVTSFEDCDFLTPPSSFAPSVVVLGGAATFVRCRIRDGLPAVYVQSSVLSLVQCEVRGGDTYHYNAATSALYAWGTAKVHASNCVLEAGRGWSQAMGWPGVFAVQDNEIDLVDCDVRGGDYLTPNALLGGAAIAASSSAVVRQHRCTLTPGVGTLGVGPTTAGNVLAAPQLGASLREPGLLLGAGLHVDLAAEPGDLVFVLASFGLSLPAPAPLVAPSHWGFAAHGTVVSLQFADAAGHATYGFAIPSDPAFRDLGVWLMGAAFAGLPGRLSPPVGGVIR